jgi:hypothetical protein
MFLRCQRLMIHHEILEAIRVLVSDPKDFRQLGNIRPVKGKG